jgi:transcriptional regulator with PAS, ATPase and Fis domain
MEKTDTLPRDAQSILELAARSMFGLFSSASEGMMLVDRQARVVWINDQYRRFLPPLGFEREEDFVGHPVSQVVQNTLMHQVLETGKPILIDLLTNRAGTFVVSRIPLRDASGLVIGALGIVLFDHAETTLQPLIEKFSLLQRDLNDVRRELATQRFRQTGKRQSKYTFGSFIGLSAAAVEVKRQARRAAQSSSPVLLMGETGTGKELLAHGGTLFLDEMGDMPLALQSKLLRALQEGEIEPLGSNKLIEFDVRVIAATSRDLPRLVRERSFREDLFYRLNVLPIRVPPLRERRGDIAALLEVLGEDVALRSGLPPPELSAQALALLEAQPWRGNIRELRNVLEQAAMRSDASRIEVTQLEAVLRESGVQPLAPTVSAAAKPDVYGTRLPPAAVMEEGDARLLRPLSLQVADLERRAIDAALKASKGNKVAAAKLLGIARATLYARL